MVEYVKVEVELLVSGAMEDEIRNVIVPYDPEKGVADLLQGVFLYGQNDIQPQKRPCVSVGEVIRWAGDKWLVLVYGFHNLTEEAHRVYLELPKEDRCLATYKFCSNCSDK